MSLFSWWYAKTVHAKTNFSYRQLCLKYLNTTMKRKEELLKIISGVPVKL